MELLNGATRDYIRNSFSCKNGHENTYENLKQDNVFPFHKIDYYCHVCPEPVGTTG